MPLQAVLMQVDSYCCHGASSVFGRWQVGLTLRRTWCAVVRTTTLPSASGAAGTGATICGSSGAFLFLQLVACTYYLHRYIYIPLGGAKHAALTTVLIFTFVALWHDISFQLLAWGWLISLFILPELLAAYLLPASKVGRCCFEF